MQLIFFNRPDSTSGKTFASGTGDGHRSLVTPERVLSEYNKDLILIFFKFSLAMVTSYF